jgi:hypothetical protein
MNKFTKYRLAGELEITVSGKLLYLLLLDTVDTEGNIIIPQRRISEAPGISRGTVSRNFRRLIWGPARDPSEAGRVGRGSGYGTVSFSPQAKTMSGVRRDEVDTSTSCRSSARMTAAERLTNTSF